MMGSHFREVPVHPERAQMLSLNQPPYLCLSLSASSHSLTQKGRKGALGLCDVPSVPINPPWTAGS